MTHQRIIRELGSNKLEVWRDKDARTLHACLSYHHVVLENVSAPEHGGRDGYGGEGESDLAQVLDNLEFEMARLEDCDVGTTPPTKQNSPMPSTKNNPVLIH